MDAYLDHVDDLRGRRVELDIEMAKWGLEKAKLEMLRAGLELKRAELDVEQARLDAKIIDG